MTKVGFIPSVTGVGQKLFKTVYVIHEQLVDDVERETHEEKSGRQRSGLTEAK